VVRAAGYRYADLLTNEPTVNNIGINKFNTDHGNFWGYMIEQFQHAIDHLQFEMNMVSPQPEDWGTITPDNGTWTGHIGRLAYDEVDLTFSYSLSHKRSQVRYLIHGCIKREAGGRAQILCLA
jgi:hypothetical protein